MAIQKSARKYDKDVVILTQGDDSRNEICYLLKGQAIVELDKSVVGTLKPGEWFGELAAILGTKRTATVRAGTPCEILVFKGVEDADLYESIAKDPKMLRKLVEQLCQRLVEASKRHVVEETKVTGVSDRYKTAISGTLFALEKLSEKYKTKILEETREHLAAKSGMPVGDSRDADPAFFPTAKPVIFDA